MFSDQFKRRYTFVTVGCAVAALILCILDLIVIFVRIALRNTRWGPLLQPVEDILIVMTIGAGILALVLVGAAFYYAAFEEVTRKKP